MEEKIKLLNEIFRGIDKEMIHMSAQEFAKSDLALKLAETIERTLELAKNNPKYNSLKISLIKYIYRCLEYYTIKGDTIDINENPAFKCVLQHFPGIQPYVKRITEDKFISCGRIYSDVMAKNEKTEVDDFIIEKYLEYGFFRRAAKVEMDDPKSRRYAMVMVTNYLNYYKTDDERYQKSYYIIEKEFKKRFNLYKDKSDYKKWDRLLYDYCDLRFIGPNWLEKILEYMNSVPIEDFMKSETYKLIIRDIKDSKDNIKAQAYINKFYQHYAIKLAKERCALDVNKDEIIRTLKPAQKASAEGYYYLFTENTVDSYSLNKIQKMHSVIEKILSKSYNGTKELSDLDKEVLERYFDEYYNLTLYTIDQVPSSRKMIRLLIDIKKFGLHIDEDTKFVKGFYAKELKEELKSNLEPDKLRKGECDRKQVATMELLTTFSTAESDILDDFLKASGKNYHSPIVTQFVETFIARRMRHKKDYEESFDFIVNYVDAITSEENFSLFNEQGVSDILQLIRCHKIPKEYSDKINEVLEKNLEISKINRQEEKQFISSFINTYKNKKVSSVEELDEFIKHVERLKLVDGRIINNDTIQFIIRQTLENDSLISKNVYKYYGFIRSTMEDFGKSDLAGKIPKDKYCYFTRDRIMKSDVLGLHNSGRILVTKDAIIKLMTQQNVKILETIYHENAHALQQFDINNGKFDNYHRYMMSKELIIERYNKDFYNINYHTMYMEIEARQKAAEKVSFLIQRLLPDLSDRIILDSIKDDLLEEIDRKIEDEKDNYRAAEKKIVSKDDDEKHSVSDIFAKTISEHPELLTSHPEFLREFNQDGTQKSLIEVLKDMDGKAELNKEGMLYLNILKNSSIILNDDALDVLRSFQYTNPRMKKYMLILERHILKIRKTELEKDSTIPSSTSKHENGGGGEFER